MRLVNFTLPLWDYLFYPFVKYWPISIIRLIVIDLQYTHTLSPHCVHWTIQIEFVRKRTNTIPIKPVSRFTMLKIMLKICLRHGGQRDNNMKLVNTYLLLGSWNDIKYALQAINDNDNEKSKTRYLWSINYLKIFYSSLEMCFMAIAYW